MTSQMYSSARSRNVDINSRINLFSQISTQYSTKHMIFYRHFYINLKKTLQALKIIVSNHLFNTDTFKFAT